MDEPNQPDACRERAVDHGAGPPETSTEVVGGVGDLVSEAVGAGEAEDPSGSDPVHGVELEGVSEQPVDEPLPNDPVQGAQPALQPELERSPVLPEQLDRGEDSSRGAACLEDEAAERGHPTQETPGSVGVVTPPLTSAPSRRVLLADNDPNVAAILELFLKRSGADVTSVPNGRAALEALAQERFGLLVCDLDMPVMSGEELLDQVGSDPATPPVFVISGYVDEVTSSRLRSHRAVVDVLRKPFDLRAFATRVADLLDGRGEAPPDAGVGLFGEA